MKKACLFLATVAFCSQSVNAERVDRISTAKLSVSDQCPLVSLRITEAEWKDDINVEFLGPIIAGLAGTLAQSGVTAIGEALEKASQERGFVAAGTAGSYLMSVQGGDTLAGIPASLDRTRKCVSLFLPSTKPDNTKLTEALKPVLDQIPPGQGKFTDDALSEYSSDLNLPALYIEAHYIPVRGGAVLRPVLVWYREKFKGAPSTYAANELHVTFGLPSTEKEYAVARMPLQKIRPGEILDWKQLKFSTSPVVARRPTSDDVDKELAATNLKLQSYRTAALEVLKAKRLFEAAKTALSGKPKDGKLKAAVELANGALEDANRARALAQPQAQNAEKPYKTGATNIGMRFVVIKKPNQFGLAIASALKGQAEAVGTAVKSELTPTADWTSNDTAYLTAIIAVDAKQREYDKVIAEGKSDNALAINDALKVLKAKANEAAIAINRTPPFSGLI